MDVIVSFELHGHHNPARFLYGDPWTSNYLGFWLAEQFGCQGHETDARLKAFTHMN